MACRGLLSEYNGNRHKVSLISCNSVFVTRIVLFITIGAREQPQKQDIGAVFTYPWHNWHLPVHVFINRFAAIRPGIAGYCFRRYH